MSGAGTWIPANHHAAAAGLPDSTEEALAYIRAAAPEGWAATEDVLWQRLLEASPAMLRFVEAHSPLRFALTPEADPLRDLGQLGAVGCVARDVPRVGAYRGQRRPNLARRLGPAQRWGFTEHVDPNGVLGKQRQTLPRDPGLRRPRRNAPAGQASRGPPRFRNQAHGDRDPLRSPATPARDRPCRTRPHSAGRSQRGHRVQGAAARRTGR